MRREAINTREHSSPLDYNCHQHKVFSDVNMSGENGKKANTGLVVLALPHVLIKRDFLSINTRFDGL